MRALDFWSFHHAYILLYPPGESLWFSVCVSLTYRWTFLSDGDRCSLRWRLTKPFRRRTSRGATYRRLNSHLASPHRTRSSNSSKTFSSALKPWGMPLGITAANANISPHAASLHRAWHESWAICHERNTHQQCSMDSRRESRWRHRTSSDRHSGLIIQENRFTPRALQASDVGLWSTIP